MNADEIKTCEAFEEVVRALLPQATIEWPDTEDPFLAVVRVRLPQAVTA
jgi:hypothetical protein